MLDHQGHHDPQRPLRCDLRVILCELCDPKTPAI